MTRDEMIQLTRELTGRQYTSLPKSFDELQEYTDRVINLKHKPLTDEEIEQIADGIPVDDFVGPTTWHLKLARAIEQAHGIIP